MTLVTMKDTGEDSADVQSDWPRFLKRGVDTESNYVSRRSVLQTGAIVTGVALSGGGVAGTVAAGSHKQSNAGGTHDRNYGDGNGLGVFLNEQAEFKDHPIWTGETADGRGESVVDVAVGAMTSVNPPDPDAPPKFPVGFEPMAVRVSPGTTVRWIWVSNPFDFPLPHDVTSLVDEDGEVVLAPDAGQRFHHYDQYTPVEDGEDKNPTFEFTFEERGNHLYYCTPHGAPFEVHGHYNALGMRGAVIVD